MDKPTQKEYDETIKKIEANTPWRFQAGVDDSSAFMILLAKDGKTPCSPTQHFTWKQLKALAALPPRPKGI